MSTETRETVRRNLYETAHHTITIEVNICEPALAPAVFDLLRQHARAHGLSDVGQIFVTVSVEFSGQTELKEVDELGARIENLWLGQITKHEAVKLREVDAPKVTLRYE